MKAPITITIFYVGMYLKSAISQMADPQHIWESSLSTPLSGQTNSLWLLWTNKAVIPGEKNNMFNSKIDNVSRDAQTDGVDVEKWSERRRNSVCRIVCVWKWTPIVFMSGSGFGKAVETFRCVFVLSRHLSSPALQSSEGARKFDEKETAYGYNWHPPATERQ